MPSGHCAGQCGIGQVRAGDRPWSHSVGLAWSVPLPPLTVGPQPVTPSWFFAHVPWHYRNVLGTAEPGWETGAGVRSWLL